MNGPSNTKSSIRKFIRPSDIFYETGRTARKLGQGGFAKVSRGVFDGREVAVKQCLSPDHPLTLHQFKEEAARMETLNHKRIVFYFGYIEENYSIVLELMEYGSLQQFLKMV